MAYEYITIKGNQYIICAGCRIPVGFQPNVTDWAAYDAPRSDKLLLSRGRDPGGDIIFEQDNLALCSECYLKAYKVRYPKAKLPALYDGRLKGAKPIPMRKVKV